MEERLIKATEMAYRVGCSVQTLTSYYKFKMENPDNEYSLMLPDYIKQGNKQTRYWKESDVEIIIQFRKSIPQGRNGVFGSVTQRYVSGSSKPHPKKKASGVYIDKINDILHDNNVETDVIEQVMELLKSELKWRQ